MTRPADAFVSACVGFARRHPAAVLEMPEPELAVDARARAHHLRSTCEHARTRMITTARLALRLRPGQTADLFGSPPSRHETRVDA